MSDNLTPQLDLHALIPSKFRSSQLLTDFLDVMSERLDSFNFTTTHLNRIHNARLVSDISDSSQEMVVNEDHSLPTDRPIHLMIWSGGTPETASTKEYVTAMYSGTGNVFVIDRAQHQTKAVSHASGSRVVLYTPLSLKEIFDKVGRMEGLLNPRVVPQEYLQKLADLLGSKLQSADYADEATRRNELLSIIPWYKVRGTYDSLNVIGLITGLDFIVFDLYTNDYQTFVQTNWFVGEVGENPPSAWGFVGEFSGATVVELDDSYYKSPHFGLFIKLNLVYPEGFYEGEPEVLSNHIWRPSLFGIPDVPDSSVRNYIEKTRPVNTVPHYGLYLECPTDQSGIPFITYDRNKEPLTATAITGNWEYADLFFDMHEGSPENLFDDGHYFDSGLETFIETIKTWKVGTDGKFLLFNDPVLSIDTVRGEGDVSGYAIFPDRFEFYVVLEKDFVASGEEKGITELGLYRGDDLVLLATFPSFYKDNQLEAFIKIIVYRTRDPNENKPVFDDIEDETVTITLPDNIMLDVHCINLCEDVNIQQE